MRTPSPSVSSRPPATSSSTSSSRQSDTALPLVAFPTTQARPLPPQFRVSNRPPPLSRQLLGCGAFGSRSRSSRCLPQARPEGLQKHRSGNPRLDEPARAPLPGVCATRGEDGLCRPRLPNQPSDLEELAFFVTEQIVDLGDHVVRLFLEVLFDPFELVAGDVA